MIIGAMNGLGPYQVIERQYLKEILREHGLAAHGLMDRDTAIRQARLAKAQLLLLGSFAGQGDRLTIQVRLIRISDQQILARVTWTDPYTNVLSAPRDLSARLLAALGNPVDPAQLEGIEKEIPRTIDVAKSYYHQDFLFGRPGAYTIADCRLRCNGFRTAARFGTPFAAAPAFACWPIMAFQRSQRAL